MFRWYSRDSVSFESSRQEYLADGIHRTWKLIALGLDASRLHPLDPTIIRHIEDPAAIQVITNCFNPAKPDYQSKAQFDTLTSAVNITPSPNGQYDMKTLKDDASWLSQTTKIDEVLALRITILEWQSRLGRQAAMNLEESGLKEFNSVKMRRQRLLEVLFEEQSWLLRCVEIIIERGVYGPLKQQDTSSESAVIKNLATALTESWNLAPMQHDGSWFNLIRDYLQLQVDSVQSGVNLFSPDDMQDYFTEHLFTLCIETSIVQVVHGLQIILIIQRSFHSLSAPQLVVDWFLWMDTTEFLHPWLSRIPTHFTRFKSAASELLVLGSLAFIDLSGAYTILPNLAAASTAKRGQDVEVYLQSISCVTEINRILEHHIGNDNEIAAPAGIAWCSLLNNIHVHATQSIEHRESRQTQSSIDNYGANQQSDGESPDESASRRSTQLNRRPSWGSDTSGQAVLFEEIDETVRNNPRGEEIIKLLGDHAANNLGGFSIIETIARSCSSRLDYDTSPELTTCIREILVEFIKTSIELGSLTYSQTVLNILFTILAGKDGHWKFRARGSPSPYPFGASCQSLGDDPLLRDLMACARGRFPHEGVPFIELCRTLLPYQDFKSTDGHVLLEILSEISTYTALLEESQLPYDLTGEGETLQLRLLCPVDVIAMTLPGLLSHSTVATSGSFDTLVMPAGTTGQPLKEDKPIIALWNFKYSGLTFWGLLLQLQLQSRPDSKRNHINESHSRLISMNTEIITFLATWIMKITTECENQHASEKTQALLENISDDLDRNQDIVAIIFALLEGELYKDVSKSFEAEFIFRCIQFLVALTKVMPGRVWSFLSRSGLLGLYGKESRLSTIIAAVEVSNGSYDILLSSTQLLDILIEDSIRGTSSLKSSAVALKRFRTFDSNTSGSGIQASTMSKILHQFTRIMVDAFETSPNWNFKSQEHELSLKLGTYRVLRKIISYAFEFDDESSPEQKVSASLGSAANYLLENFLSEAASDTLLQPLFQELADIVIKPSTSLSSRISTLCHSVAFASLELIIQLIRLNCFLGYSTSNVTKKVHENIQLLVNLFVLYDDLRSPVVRTLDAAIRDIGRNSRPAPILEALSEPTAKAFIECLETLGLSETNPSLSAATWSFFSNAIMRKQQWVAVYLLLGKTPRESLKSSSGSSTNSIIYLASKRIANLEILDPEEALKLLEFVTYSANFSVDIMIEIVKNKECRASCLRYLSNLQPVKKDVDINAKIPTKFQIAAYIVDILALLVNKSNQGKDKTILMHLIPNIKYLIEHGASSPLYNSSLHHTIQKNFEELFPGRSLRHFKKTNFSQPKLGDQFYYDKALADTIFNQNQAWTGKMGKGFNREFTRANINLSLVEAQIVSVLDTIHTYRANI